MNLRKQARGKPCLVRLPGICTFDDERTVLAHIRRGGVCGTGMKPHDLSGVRACDRCHDAIGDGKPEFDSEIVDAWCRTMDAYKQEGLI